MQLLQKEYLDNRLQKHFESLQLPQTRIWLKHDSLVEALRNKGAIQPTEAPEPLNIFRWPFDLKGDGNDPFFLTHCNLRFFYMYHGKKWKKHELCLTMGLFATYCCKKEKPDILADEIIRIDQELIPQWIVDFNNLHPLRITGFAMQAFPDQSRKLRDQRVVLDTFAARVYGVSVTEVRQTITRNKDFFGDFAFHLTWPEHQAWDKHTIGAPKVHKGDYLPYALTFQAYCLLSMCLRSPIAIKVHQGINQTQQAQKPLKELLKQLEQDQ